MKVVYIASSAHSGSTLLDLMLNAHSDGVTVGEIEQLPDHLGQTRRLCTCGVPARDCAFWQRVDGAVRTATGGRALADLNIRDSLNAVAWRTDNRLLFEAVGRVTGAGFVIDSSKAPGRLEMLLDTPGLEVLPVFLLRNPKGQILSMIQSGERKRRRPDRLARLVWTYDRENLWFHSILRHRPHVRLRYEELVRNTDEVLTVLMQRIGVGYQPQQREFARHERHNIGGNRVRRTDSNELHLDEAWRRDLRLLTKVAIDIGTVPGRYAFRRLERGTGAQVTLSGRRGA